LRFSETCVSVYAHEGLDKNFSKVSLLLKLRLDELIVEQFFEKFLECTNALIEFLKSQLYSHSWYGQLSSELIFEKFLQRLHSVSIHERVTADF